MAVFLCIYSVIGAIVVSTIFTIMRLESTGKININDLDIPYLLGVVFSITIILAIWPICILYSILKAIFESRGE